MTRGERLILTYLVSVFVVTIGVFLHLGEAAVPDGSIDRDIHESVVRLLESQAGNLKIEAGVIIASMADAIDVLYLNGRKDLRESRKVIQRLATALENLPCRPEMCREIPETESEVS